MQEEPLILQLYRFAVTSGSTSINGNSTLMFLPVVKVDAFRVLAGKLCGAAGGIQLAALLPLVRPVPAVVVVVALPVRVDAAPVPAPELVLTAFLVRRTNITIHD